MLRSPEVILSTVRRTCTADGRLCSRFTSVSITSCASELQLRHRWDSRWRKYPRAYRVRDGSGGPLNIFGLIMTECAKVHERSQDPGALGVVVEVVRKERLRMKGPAGAPDCRRRGRGGI